MVSVNMIPLLNLDLVLGGSDSKESAFDAGDLGSIAWWSLMGSCLWGRTESDTTEAT